MASPSGVNIQLGSGTAIRQNGGMFCCFGRVEEEPDMAPPDEDFHCKKVIRLPHGYTAYRLIEPSNPTSSPAPLTVLIHGMYNSGYMWADLAELMAEFEQGPKCRVLIYDLYGRGRSPWTGLPLSLDMYVMQIKELLDGEW
ncbi:alpha/beta hydrolase [archaeon]|nr:MAG: alpha/beta hydrolase [archaeon]